MTYTVHNSIVPESLLTGDPKELASTLAAWRPVDAAEALNGLDADVAARALEEMPAPAAIQILNEGHVAGPADMIALLALEHAAAILGGLHPDRRADIYRELPEG